MQRVESLLAQGKMKEGFTQGLLLVEAGKASETLAQHIHVLHSLGFAQLPKASLGTKQYEENAAEQYAVLSPFYQFQQHQDYTQFGEMVEQSLAGDQEQQAAAYAMMGWYYAVTDEAPKAFVQWAEALKLQPNQAMYWGLFAQMLNDYGGHPLLALRLIEEAQLLDAANPRWPYIAHHIFIHLATATKNLNYVMGAQQTLQRTKALIREEQVPLKIAIAKCDDVLRQWESQLL